MTVLVTGASGFLGRNVLEALHAAGVSTVAGVRNISAPRGLERSAVVVDLRSREQLDHTLAELQPRAVVHCAAYGVDHRQQDATEAYEVNVVGTLALYYAARREGVTRFVHVGTCYEYGGSAKPIDERHVLQPVGIYGTTKAAGSMLLLAAGRLAPPGPVVLRPFGMFGPGEAPHKLVPQVLDAVRRRRALDLTAAREVRDYLPVTDVARGIAALIDLPDELVPHGEIFNVCSGHPRSIRELVEAIAEAAGGGAQLRFGAVPSRSDAPSRVVGDPHRWQSLWHRLGRPDVAAITSLEATVQRMMAEPV